MQKVSYNDIPTIWTKSNIVAGLTFLQFKTVARNLLDVQIVNEHSEHVTFYMFLKLKASDSNVKKSSLRLDG